jgi:hypothetical protein
MPVELPPISQDVNDPLPTVDPNSDLVPYRLSRTDPGQEPVITTGYGARARPPIQPPNGGGVGVPDLGPLYAEAFKQLPVDQALKAVDAATKFVAQRGYMKDINSGQNSAQAFAKWGPMLFKTAVGIPEAIDRSVPTPITPQQMIQNARNSRLDAERLAAANANHALAVRKQAFEESKPPASTNLGKLRQELRAAKDSGDEEGAKQTQNEIDKITTRPGKTVPLSIPVDPDNPFGAHMTIPLSQDDPLVKKLLDRAHTPKAEPVVEPSLLQKAKSALGLGSPTPPPAQTPFREGATIRNKKDGKLYKVVNGAPVLVKE